MSGIEIAFANAIGEITLVFFTTLAPAATLAYLLLLFVWAFRAESAAKRRRVRTLLWIPLVLAMLGLVASATHLGNPANALYVLTRVGTSPLSNEVCAAVVFLACAAIFWLSGFSLAEHRLLDRILAVAVTAAGIVFILAVALAYRVETILTWNLPVFPLTIVASAFVAAPVLTLLVLQFVDLQASSQKLRKLLIACGIVASCLWAALHIVLGLMLPELGNALFSASELVPCYWPALIAALLMLAASYLFVIASTHSDARRHVLRYRALATALVLISIFVMRFVFYMLHMTVGVAV